MDMPIAEEDDDEGPSLIQQMIKRFREQPPAPHNERIGPEKAAFWWREKTIRGRETVVGNITEDDVRVGTDSSSPYGKVDSNLSVLESVGSNSSLSSMNSSRRSHASSVSRRYKHIEDDEDDDECDINGEDGRFDHDHHKKSSSIADRRSPYADTSSGDHRNVSLSVDDDDDDEFDRRTESLLQRCDDLLSNIQPVRTEDDITSNTPRQTNPPHRQKLAASPSPTDDRAAGIGGGYKDSSVDSSLLAVEAPWVSLETITAAGHVQQSASVDGLNPAPRHAGSAAEVPSCMTVDSLDDVPVRGRLHVDDVADYGGANDFLGEEKLHHSLPSHTSSRSGISYGGSGIDGEMFREPAITSRYKENRSEHEVRRNPPQGHRSLRVHSKRPTLALADESDTDGGNGDGDNTHLVDPDDVLHRAEMLLRLDENMLTSARTCREHNEPPTVSMNDPSPLANEAVAGIDSCQSSMDELEALRLIQRRVHNVVQATLGATNGLQRQDSIDLNDSRDSSATPPLALDISTLTDESIPQPRTAPHPFTSLEPQVPTHRAQAFSYSGGNGDDADGNEDGDQNLRASRDGSDEGRGELAGHAVPPIDVPPPRSRAEFSSATRQTSSGLGPIDNGEGRITHIDGGLVGDEGSRESVRDASLSLSMDVFQHFISPSSSAASMSNSHSPPCATLSYSPHSSLPESIEEHLPRRLHEQHAFPLHASSAGHKQTLRPMPSGKCAGDSTLTAACDTAGRNAAAVKGSGSSNEADERAHRDSNDVALSVDVVNPYLSDPIVKSLWERLCEVRGQIAEERNRSLTPCAK